MKVLYNLLLPKILNNKCQNRIPRSGEKGKRVNCFSVRLDRDSNPFLLVESFKDNKLIGKKWDGNKFSQVFDINIKDINEYELEITHFFGLITITFNGINDYAWNYYSKYIYIKLWLRNIIENIDQYFFNKKKIITEDRLSLLNNMITIQLDKYHSGISFIGLMTELYSFKWLNHPNKDYEKRKLKLYLDSLLETGDIEYKNDRYIVTGKAISTLEAYEKSEEKNINSIKHQRKIVFLTVIIAIATLLQTEIIKIPTIINFDSKVELTRK